MPHPSNASQRMKDAFLSPALIVLCAILALPLAGFGCGVLVCSDCDGDPANHIFMGLIHSILTTVGLGRCYVSASSSINLWPFILMLALALWLATGAVRYWRARRR